MSQIICKNCFSSKSKVLKIVNKYKFNFAKFLAGNTERWRCIVNSCRSYLKFDKLGVVVESSLNHNHSPPENLARQIFRNSLKRKTVNDISSGPSKHICNKLRAQKENAPKLTCQDLTCFRRNISYNRFSHFPKLPKITR